MSKRICTDTVDEEIHAEKTNKVLDDNGIELTHPSWGKICVSRGVSGGYEEHFGSDVKTHSTITLEISTANQTNSSGKSYHFAKDTILKIAMTPVQYAEMISNPNTEGVPCTIEYRSDLGYIKYHAPYKEIEKVKEKLDDTLDNYESKIAEADFKINEILNKKGSILKKDREEIASLNQYKSRLLKGSLPFYSEKYIEKIKSAEMEVKSNVNSLNTYLETKIGQEALKRLGINISDPNRLLTNGENDEKEIN